MSDKQLQEIGERITTALREQRFTQAEVARRAGVSSGYVSDVMRGIKRPSDRILAGLFQLGISRRWILEGAGEMLVNEGRSPLAIPDDTLDPGAGQGAMGEDVAAIIEQLQRLHERWGARGETHALLSQVLRERPDLEDVIQTMLRAFLKE